MQATIWIGARPMEMKKMTTVTAINNVDHGLTDGGPITMQQSLRRWNTGLFVSGALGAISGLIGLMIGFLTLIELFAPTTKVYTIGTVLIGASFILFGLAAHCLDRVDATDKAIRLEYCRQHGLKDEDHDEVKNTK
jgi:hypothetical protein